MVSAKNVRAIKWESVSKWTLDLLLLGLVIYCAGLLAQATWLLLPSGASAIPDDVSLSSSGISLQSSPSRDSSVLLSMALFGKETKAKPAQQTAKNVVAPKTSLQLELKGVFTAEQDGESSAIVAERGRPGSYYKVGDKLPGNAELNAVYSDRVLLKRNGRLETLSFADAISKTNTIAKVNAGARRAISSPKQFVDEATKRITEDPRGALASVGLRPVQAGNSDGYVYDGKNPMLGRMNLKKGDVVRSVNGYPLGDINKDKALMKQLYEEGSLEVEVERDGTSFYVNYPLR